MGKSFHYSRSILQSTFPLDCKKWKYCLPELSKLDTTHVFTLVRSSDSVLSFCFCFLLYGLIYVCNCFCFLFLFSVVNDSHHSFGISAPHICVRQHLCYCVSGHLIKLLGDLLGLVSSFNDQGISKVEAHARDSEYVKADCQTFLPFLVKHVYFKKMV